MKFILLFTLMFGFNLKSTAQSQDFNEYYSIYMQGYNTKNLSKMKEGSELLINNLPDEFAGFYLHTFYQICAGNLKEAQADVNKAFNISPLSPYPYMVQSYIYFVNGNYDLYKKNITYAAQLRSHNSFDDIYKDIEILEHYTKKNFSSFRSVLTGLSNRGVMNADLAMELDQCFTGIQKGTPCGTIDEVAAKFNAMPTPNPVISEILPLIKALNFYNNGNILESMQQFETFVNNTKGNSMLYWKRSYAFWFLSVLKSDNLDERGALLSINAALDEYKNLGFNSCQLANLQLHKIYVLKSLGEQQQEKLQTAYQLEQTANVLNNDYYKAKAYNSIGAYFTMDGPQSEINKGGLYLNKAYNLTQKINDISLSREVAGNYIIVKARQGLYADAERITEETAKGYINDKEFNHAQNLYNNLGFIYFNNKDYTKAIVQFEKSTALVKHIKSGLNAKQKLEYMNDVSGVYSGLAMSYKHTGEVEKLFTIQEQSRSGYLKDMLSADTETATISEAQQLLKADEVLLTYTIGRPGEIIVTVVTQNKAEIRYNYPVDELLQFKKLYTDRVKKVPAALNPYISDLNVDYKDGQLIRYASKEAAYTKEDFILFVEWTRQLLESTKPEIKKIRQDFLRLWYDLTITPVEDIVSKYPNVIISCSSELNYLPFEAFLSTNNEYFVEKHTIKYISGTTIWKIINGRKYSDSRKSVIAFGGALFQPSGNVKATVRGIEDFYKISDAVNKKINEGIYNFKPELEAVGFGGANYLAGTFNEVNYVGTLSDDAKVLTGFEMSESNFKKLNASGELKHYKNLLISTHGFTDDIIPQFSGLMFTQPNNGDENEDTFLLTPEIAKLNLNADLVVLSACNTGVGKLYGGEGINGLNTAFLIAGSNANILSLWPVDDAGTTLTMQNLFRNIIQNKADTAATLCQIKRSFIKGDFGEEYKKPSYWAPFLYHGN